MQECNGENDTQADHADPLEYAKRAGFQSYDMLLEQCEAHQTAAHQCAQSVQPASVHKVFDHQYSPRNV